MSKEIFQKCGCDRCPIWTTVPIKAGLFGFFREKPYPDTWSIVNDTVFCPTCKSEYEKQFDVFMKTVPERKEE